MREDIEGYDKNWYEAIRCAWFNAETAGHQDRFRPVHTYTLSKRHPIHRAEGADILISMPICLWRPALKSRVWPIDGNADNLKAMECCSEGATVCPL